MTFLLTLPSRPGGAAPVPAPTLDVLDGSSTAVQRHLRRGGISRYEPATMGALLALLEMQPKGFVFFDVGANVGLYSAMCDLLFEPSHVIAFEPTPSTAAIARRIAKRNGLRTVVERAAVGPADGTAPLYLSATSDASNSMVLGFKENVGAEAVPVVSLDSYVASSGLEPDVVKMDVETFEPDVIAGAHQLLLRRRPALIVEVLNRRGHDHGEEIGQALAPYGYTAYRLPTVPTWQPEDRITGELGSEDRDWLLVPEPLPGDFAQRYAAWRERLDDADRQRAAAAKPAPKTPAKTPDADSASVPSGARSDAGVESVAVTSIAARPRAAARAAIDRVRAESRLVRSVHRSSGVAAVARGAGRRLRRIVRR